MAGAGQKAAEECETLHLHCATHAANVAGIKLPDSSTQTLSGLLKMYTEIQCGTLRVPADLSTWSKTQQIDFYILSQILEAHEGSFVTRTADFIAIKPSLYDADTMVDVTAVYLLVALMDPVDKDLRLMDSKPRREMSQARDACKEAYGEAAAVIFDKYLTEFAQLYITIKDKHISIMIAEGIKAEDESQESLWKQSIALGTAYAQVLTQRKVIELFTGYKEEFVMDHALANTALKHRGNPPKAACIFFGRTAAKSHYADAAKRDRQEDAAAEGVASPPKSSDNPKARTLECQYCGEKVVARSKGFSWVRHHKPTCKKAADWPNPPKKTANKPNSIDLLPLPYIVSQNPVLPPPSFGSAWWQDTAGENVPYGQASAGQSPRR